MKEICKERAREMCKNRKEERGIWKQRERERKRYDQRK